MQSMDDIFSSLRDFNFDDINFEPFDAKYWRRGWKHTEEAKLKMSLSKKGKEPWNKGLTGFSHSEETKEKMRKRMKGNSYTKGRKLTEEEKKKRSDSLKEYYKKRRESGYKR